VLSLTYINGVKMRTLIAAIGQSSRWRANTRGRPSTTLSVILWFYPMILFKGVHPLDGRHCA